MVVATTNSEELEKRLGAAMLSGRALIALDNLNGVLTSDLLCQAVTQPLVAYRLPGASTENKLTWRSVFVANGNNISIADDLGRRTLLVQLDAKIEKPWQRAFQYISKRSRATEASSSRRPSRSRRPISRPVFLVRPMQACGESRARPARAPIPVRNSLLICWLNISSRWRI